MNILTKRGNCAGINRIDQTPMDVVEADGKMRAPEFIAFPIVKGEPFPVLIEVKSKAALPARTGGAPTGSGDDPPPLGGVRRLAYEAAEFRFCPVRTGTIAPKAEALRYSIAQFYGPRGL